MEGDRFDRLARTIATGRSRRDLLRAAFGTLLSGIAAAGLADEVEAAARCRGFGSVCAKNDDCCSGLCFPPDRTGRRRCARSLGERTTSAAQCASGIAADGVCCDHACSGQCEACNLPGKAGTCSPVTGAPSSGHPACAGSGACAGSCNGTNRTACAYPGAGTTCAPAACDGNGNAVTYACDGRGGCGQTTAPCGLYACANGTCKTGCATDDDCIGAAYCNGGACAADLANGQPCGERGQCQSGNCVDGVCCVSSACPECQSCAAGNGACAVVADGTRCATGFCHGGVCCPQGQKPCNGECIDARSCCTDADCGPSGVTCQKQTCTGGSCVFVNADSDPGCVSDSCFSRACTSGTCVETPIADCGCPSGQKLCQGSCIPSTACCSDADCHYDCMACQDGQCVESCPPSALACQGTGQCAPDGSCAYIDSCPACLQCGSEGSCVPVPDYTKITDVYGVVHTCCSGLYLDDSFLCFGAKNCPTFMPGSSGETLSCCGEFVNGVCCSPPNAVVLGVCCPGSEYEVIDGQCVTSGPSGGGDCPSGQTKCNGVCCSNCNCTLGLCNCLD